MLSESTATQPTSSVKPMATNMRKLEKSVQSQLRSDLTTNSVTNCVIELVENAIDAHSTSIAIRINFQTFQIQVIDNGTGMTEEQLKIIGKRSCTSKWKSKSKSKFFGYRGESLADMRKSCDRLLIITRTAENKTTFCKEFNFDGNSRVEKSVHERVTKGTTLIMENVLRKTPVRQARVIPSVEWQNIKQYIRAIALMHPLICFSVEDSLKSVEVLRIKRAKTTQKQLTNLYPEITENSTMMKLVSENGNTRLKAIVSDRMCQIKTLQFVYVNKRYVYKSDMEKYFKKLLQKCFRDMETKEALKVRSRWQPVFVLNVTCPESEYHIFYELNNRHVEFKNRNVVKYCLVELFNEFRGRFGMDKISLTHRSGLLSKDKKNSKNTFISQELFQKLNKANTIFGIPTTRAEIRGSRCKNYLNKKSESKEPKQSDEKRVRSDRRDSLLEEYVMSLRRPELYSRDADNERENSFEDLFFENRKEECSASKTEGNEKNDLEEGAGNENFTNLAPSATRGNVQDDPFENGNFSMRNETFHVTLGDTPAKSVLDCLPNSELEGRLLSAAINSPRLPTEMKKNLVSVNSVFDYLPNFEQQGGILPVVTNSPKLPPETTKNLVYPRNDSTGECNAVDSEYLATSVENMLKNCMNKNNEAGYDRSKPILPPQQTKKPVLREPKLKFDGFLHTEFTLKPTGNTFVSYFEKRSTTTDGTTNGIHIDNSVSENKVPKLDSSKRVNCEMKKLTIKTNIPHLESSEIINSGNSCHYRHRVSPDGCCCTCHKTGSQRIHEPESTSVNIDIGDETQLKILNAKTPVLEEQFSRQGENPSVKSVPQDFVFTPYFASPYFVDSSRTRLEENPSMCDPPAPVDQTTTNECRNSPVIRVVDSPSLKLLKKKTNFRKKCKLLSSAAAVDIPSGMLEASRLNNRKYVLSDKVDEELHELIKPYNVKNHYTLDDNGQSCLRVFPHLKKTEQSTANYLTVPEELNCFFPFNKFDLHNIRFLFQIDRKFLLTILHRIETNEEIIVIFDQHALDERIRVEHLFRSYTDNSGIWKSTSVNPAIYPDVTSFDLPILRDFRTIFEEKGLYFKFNKGSARSTQPFLIAVIKVPTCLHSKAMREGAASEFGSKLKELTEALIKELIEMLTNAQYLKKNLLPDTLRDTLNYEACRGAIKFGDKLPTKVCASLLKRVSSCEKPFQCAHGRPLMAPLISLTKIETFLAKKSSATKCSAEKLKSLMRSNIVRKL